MLIRFVVINLVAIIKIYVYLRTFGEIMVFKFSAVSGYLFVLVLICFLGRVSSSNVCSSDEVAVQDFTKNVESNGCSKPDFLKIGGEEDFTSCCDLHDACYATCGLSQNYCDRDFERCMQNLCNDFFSSNRECSSAANMYAHGSSMFGLNSYMDTQKEHCTCVHVDDVLDHYAKGLNLFYSKHVPVEKRQDGKKILSGSKYSSKENPSLYIIYKLFYNLVKKYQNSILHVGNRVGRQPPPNRDIRKWNNRDL